MRRIRDHGRRSKHSHEVPGWCSRLDGLQAAVLLAARPSPGVDRSPPRTRRGVQIPDGILVPWEQARHHLIVARVPDPTRLLRPYPRRHRHGPLSQPLNSVPWLQGSSLPASEKAASEVLSLPIDPLMEVHEVGWLTPSLPESQNQQPASGHERRSRGDANGKANTVAHLAPLAAAINPARLHVVRPAPLPHGLDAGTSSTPESEGAGVH